MKKKLKGIWIAVIAILGLVLTFGSADAYSSNAFNLISVGTKGNINLSYVTWDTEIASTNVIAEVLRQAGYTVETTPLDLSLIHI